MTQRKEITSMEEFHALPAEQQQQWKQIVFSYALVRGASACLDDVQHAKLDAVLEVLNTEMQKFGEDGSELTKYFLSPTVEATLIVESTREALITAGWSLQ